MGGASINQCCIARPRINLTSVACNDLNMRQITKISASALGESGINLISRDVADRSYDLGHDGCVVSRPTTNMDHMVSRLQFQLLD